MIGGIKLKRILSLILSCLILVLSGCTDKNETKIDVNFYYADSEKTAVNYEEITVKYTNREDPVLKVMERLLQGPKSSKLYNIIPEGTSINEVVTNNNLVVVDFSKEFITGNDIENILIRASVVNTLTSIDGIDNVLILVNGDNLKDKDGNIIGIIKKEDIVLDEELTKETDMYVKLYFAEPDYGMLGAEGREITVSQNELTEMRIVKELLKGPGKKDHKKTIPDETKILSVETKDGTCFVNLSQEFISRNQGGISSQTLSVYSIVNSLTELNSVDKVQFLIEGQKVETFIDMIFNEPFVRDDGLIR